MDIILNIILILGVMSFVVGIYRIISYVLNIVYGEKEAIVDEIDEAASSKVGFDALRSSISAPDKFLVFILDSFKLEEKLYQIHALLGSPKNLKVEDMLRQKVMFAIFIPIMSLVLFKSILLFFVLIPLAFFIPDFLMKKKIETRSQEMLGHFPMTIDLLALILESGLDYVTAIGRIITVAKEKTTLEVELETLLTDIQLGYSRRDALNRLASRTNSQEIRSFVGILIQSDELGTSLVDLVRNFSTDLRFRRITKAEKLAAQASTKMLLPMFLFIFPTVFVLILAPMLYDMVSGGNVF